MLYPPWDTDDRDAEYKPEYEMDKVKKLKDKAVPEDEVKQVEKEIQDITDKFIAECDQIFSAKEKEIMTV